MIGSQPSIVTKICWAFICPVALLVRPLEITQQDIINCKYKKYKHILKYIISGYFHPLLGLLGDTGVQPDGDRKYLLFAFLLL